MRLTLPCPALLLLPLLACAPDAGGLRRGAAEVDSADPDLGEDTDDDTGGDTADDTGPAGPCPRRMAQVDEGLCIDVAEAALEEQTEAGGWAAASPFEQVGGRVVRAVVALHAVPQGYISGDEAEAACEAAGKRLCSSEEWLAACRGPEQTVYPYGDTYDSDACNDHYGGSHPVVDYFGTADGVWDTEHMNDPGINQQEGTVSPGGDWPDCVSAAGAYDLHGNLHEWVADSDGTFRGGFYADASINGPGCTYTTTAHSRSYHDYSTGFRCCLSID